MEIEVINLGPMGNCTYLLSEGQEALLVDPAWDMNFLEHTLKQKGLNLRAVFFTHGHFDHVKFSQELLQKHGLKAYLEQHDVPLSGLDPQFLHTYTGAQTVKEGRRAACACISAMLFLREIHSFPGLAGGWICPLQTRAKCARAW